MEVVLQPPKTGVESYLLSEGLDMALLKAAGPLLHLRGSVEVRLRRPAPGGQARHLKPLRRPSGRPSPSPALTLRPSAPAQLCPLPFTSAQYLCGLRLRHSGDRRPGLPSAALFELWDKSSKARKLTSTSTPTPISEEVESNLQLALVPTHDETPQPERERGSPTPIIEDDEAVDEDDESIPQFEADLAALERDPSKRLPISSYHVNDQDRVRRRYIDLGACQPKDHKFEIRDFSGHSRRLSPTWFKDHKWLEYSMEKEAAFCFVCYLFKDKTKSPGGDAFVNGGFNNWNMKGRLKRHIGAVSSAHAEAQEKYDMFTTPTTSIRESIASNTSQYKALYKQRLTWTLKCVRFLLSQGLAFRGHDESEDSLNKGNFLELLNWLAGNFEEVDRVVLKNAPQNCKMTHHDIQQEVIKCCAQEITKLVIEELDGGHFAILANESSDVYQNEQLVVCLRYVDKKGRAVVRFHGLAHVEDTTSLTLKAAIQKILMDYNLTFAMVRGQGYDGASNMRGNVNGLKKLIMDESPSAYYVHCFAHQLQLTLVAVAKESGDCTWFFQQLAHLLNALRVWPRCGLGIWPKARCQCLRRLAPGLRKTPFAPIKAPWAIPLR
ncbi:zinc finger MYM-type protein 1-like [Triticum dicoccoides]|uniref:zinc finger MYM-type protein 1-like n=1 Tax=Triticum dicoccoides TaxID=85692 RepID=UPI001891315D|nr:zinc finger MYM-type protein 1-like [Triticum dicoccoides]